MSNRAIRRAAERHAAKLAAKANKTMTMSASAGGSKNLDADHFDFIEPTETETDNNHPNISEARLNANRANAQFSSGPRTPEGKAKSCMNAVKTGLTGQTVLLPTDDAVAYQAYIDSIFRQFSPATEQEQHLTQLIADTEWRIQKIAPLEANIFAVARLEQPDWFYEEQDEEKREVLLYTKIRLIYEKQFKNLALQERRLRNQHKSDTAKLEQLQKERLDKQQQAEAAEKEERRLTFQRLVKIAGNCAKYQTPFRPADHGFAFSLDEYTHYCNRQEAQFRLTEENLDFHQVIADLRKAKKAA